MEIENIKGDLKILKIIRNIFNQGGGLCTVLMTPILKFEELCEILIKFEENTVKRKFLLQF